MTANLTLYKKHYEVFLKWVEKPVEISGTWWEILQKILEDKNCPPFVKIHEHTFNIYEITRIVPHEEHMSPEKANAIKKLKEVELISVIPVEYKSSTEIYKENPKYQDWMIKNKILINRLDGTLGTALFDCISEDTREISDKRVNKNFPFFAHMFEMLYQRLWDIELAMEKFDATDTAYIAMNRRLICLPKQRNSTAS